MRRGVAMDSFIANIESLGEISPIIPDAIIFGLIIVIFIIALIPVSLACWILAAAFSKSLDRL